MTHPIRQRACPACQARLTVQASHRRKVHGYEGTYRLLKCRACGHKTSTHEVVADDLAKPRRAPAKGKRP